MPGKAWADETIVFYLCLQNIREYDIQVITHTTWQQNYTPLNGSLGLFAVVAALPIFVVLFLLGVLRKPAWVAALAGLGTASGVALLAYGMPASTTFAAISFGAAFGLFPIAWIVFWAIALYRLTLDTGNFEILKNIQQ